MFAPAPTPAFAPASLWLFDWVFEPSGRWLGESEPSGAAGSTRSASSLLRSRFAPSCMVGLPTLALPATPAPTWAKAGIASAPAKIAAVNAVRVRFIGGLLERGSR